MQSSIGTELNDSNFSRIIKTLKIKNIFISFFAITLLSCGSLFSPVLLGDDVKKPNIILIMADDVGYEAFKTYGGRSYKTPVLDNMARTGLQFNHCYSQPLCTPTRVQIMTGKYNNRNYTGFGILDPKEKTFGNVLKDAGYVTCIAGKWQLYGDERQRKLTEGFGGTTPDKAGFDEYCLWQIKKKGARFWGATINENGVVSTKKQTEYGPDFYTQFITKFIRENKDNSFFVYYPMALVHNPFLPTPDSKDKKNKNLQENFADMMTYTDKLVGEIVEEVDDCGLSENTLIIFVSDNGTNRGITSDWQGQQLKGNKGGTNDLGNRVPCIMRWKGVTPQGKQSNDLLDFSDMLPTFAEMAGVQLTREDAIDGQSFLAQLKGERGNPRTWTYCYYDCRWGKFKKSVFARDQRYKLFDNGNLYDVPADLYEKNPIAVDKDSKESKQAREKLQAVLDRMAKK